MTDGWWLGAVMLDRMGASELAGKVNWQDDQHVSLAVARRKRS